MKSKFISNHNIRLGGFHPVSPQPVEAQRLVCLDHISSRASFIFRQGVAWRITERPDYAVVDEN
jgi:hypothetical protein